MKFHLLFFLTLQLLLTELFGESQLIQKAPSPDSFKGLTSLNVSRVEFHGFSPFRFSLSPDQIRASIKKKLKNSGITIDRNCDSYVVIKVLSTDANCTWGALLSMDILEKVTVERDGESKFCQVYGNNWIGLSNNKEVLGKNILNAIEDWLDDFLSLYNEANPKKIVPQPKVNDESDNKIIEELWDFSKFPR